MRSQSIAIQGGGVAGLIMAHALARLNLDVTLIEPYPPLLSFEKERDIIDGRTAMILARHVEWLKTINAWNDNIDTLTAPLSTMRIIDDSVDDKTASDPVDFCASDLKQTAFGYNTPLKMYRAFLWDHLPDKISILKEKDDAHYDLKIAADGRLSPLREEAQITAHFEDCQRAALTFVIEHSWHHNNISTEVQKREGPITCVPLPDPHHSSVVLTGRDKFINNLKNNDKKELKEYLYKTLRNQQDFEIITNIEVCPLSFMSVETLFNDNIVLTAEAAHVLHPMGAQGLNLSIGDMHTLYGLIENALNTGQSVAHPIHVLRPYAKQRARAHAIRHIGIQSSLAMLERGNLTGTPRRLILNWLRHNPTLKKVLMSAQK